MHSVLASAISTDAFHPCYLLSQEANTHILSTDISVSGGRLHIQVSLSFFLGVFGPVWIVMMKNRVTFAVSTLGALLGVLPQCGTLIISLGMLNPKDIDKRGPPFYGALSGKRGSAQCELKRPSFGCLILKSNGTFLGVLALY